ncbi:hypothetical protein WN59_09920 [Salinicoccus sediminis]|uniref:Glycosyltransferase RgtA/B/C/D-like domain-containing protein n=1 Tax=Salinicoccus sediminis TaxID=1432562 RepID=A0A0M2SMU0_9STAP|nr:hypothetical protein [Salinicoccus sediminis]KKK33915.1 hypothetical protein WN59_09920 [Salinicoccus sediminis]
MLLIWGVTLIYLFLGSVMNHYYIPDSTYLTVTFICITSILLLLALLVNYPEFCLVIFMSFIVRIILMLVDLYGRDVFEIPHSGNDTENFYRTGVMVSENLSMLGESVYGGVYSHMLGILFNIYGDDRLFAQYLNILIAMTAILIVIRIFRMLGIPHRVQLMLVLVMGFFPHSLIFSGILLRESIISLMVVMSLYCFIRWFKDKERAGAVLSVVLVLLGASFHSAIIGMLLGYLFGFIFYRHDEKAFRFTLESVVPFSIFALILTYILVFPSIVSGLPIFNKVDQVLNNNDNIYEAFTSTRGDTAYLSGLEVNNLFQVILFAPVKIVYFIASPMPWSIRNFNDLISFFLDGVFYLFSLAIFVRNIDVIRKRPILGILLISIFAGWLIFGLGISNAGTALRHRFKFFYMVIVALGVIGSKRDEEKRV